MEIPFKDWKRLDIRVGEIKEAGDHPNASKLLVLKVDIGDEERNIVAGIKNYDKEDLIGKKIIVFCNLEQKELRGIKSEGMLLAADEDGTPTLIVPEKDLKNGAKIE